MDPVSIAADGMSSAWGQIFAQLGVVAALVWYLWYTTSVTIPKLTDSNNTRVQAIVDKHDDTIKEIVEDFCATNKETRDEHRAHYNELKGAIQCRNWSPPGGGGNGMQNLSPNQNRG